ncbi:MAG: FHA domain-containing protein [Verrucomicrobia bacterium]|nr:FHA domain-containing protein [Verrucomicrobiota bacterium]
MAKLVVLSEGFAGRSYELKVDKTTIGRVDDNTFPITEPSISSHHCEVLLRGNEVVVKDLGSTNGTFINGQKITEGVLKPGQILRLGQIEVRLESDTPGSTAKKTVDQTMVIPQGVKLNDLEQGPRTSGFDTTSKAFSKKTDKANKYFIVFGIIVAVIIAVLLFIALQQAK